MLCCPPDRVGDFWPFSERHIRAATGRNGITELSAVKDDVFSGRALLWVAADEGGIRGAGVTQLAGRVCEIVAWGCEEQARCTDLLKTIETYAEAEGCAAVRLIGPRAWQRILPGYRTKAVILEKAI